jgi:predicted amidophosphoribosyltransferase
MHVEVERTIVSRPWCYMCARDADVTVRVPVVCPWCGAEVSMRICLDCARKLRDLLDQALREVGAQL